MDLIINFKAYMIENFYFIIIFVIKFYFFTRINNLEWKLYTFQFFAFFYKKIIEIICIMLVVIIKDLELYLNNKNFSFKKIKFN